MLDLPDVVQVLVEHLHVPPVLGAARVDEPGPEGVAGNRAVGELELSGELLEKMVSVIKFNLKLFVCG